LGVLPNALLAAVEARDWPRVRLELSTIMDTAITDGAYGRALLQLVLSLPEGIDAVLDRYRASAMLDHGDWDGIRATLPQQSIEPRQVRGMRDVLTAYVDRVAIPEWT